MKIFIVEVGWNYEGFLIQSVWTTREAAEQRAAEITASPDGKWYDSVAVTEHEVKQ